MDDMYTYADLRLARGGWPALRAATESMDKVGLFRGEIGAATDEAVLLRAGNRSDLADDASWLRRATTTVLIPTARPKSAEVLAESGVYAHRWFQIAPSDLDEFVALSVDAWKSFEAANRGTRIIGLWRAEQATETQPLLLLTRYPSLSAWERSRTRETTPPADMDPDLYEASRRNFNRRAELTLWSVVRTYRLVGAGQPAP